MEPEEPKFTNVALKSGTSILVCGSVATLAEGMTSHSEYAAVTVPVFMGDTYDVTNTTTMVINIAEIEYMVDVDVTRAPKKQQDSSMPMQPRMMPRAKVGTAGVYVDVLDTYDDLINQFTDKQKHAYDDLSEIEDAFLEVIAVNPDGKAYRMLVDPSSIHSIMELEHEVEKR